MQYIDLTHTFSADMPVFPGDSHPHLKQVANFVDQGFVDHELKSGMHVGTHMDAPLHMIENGSFASDVGVEKFFCEGVLLDASQEEVIDVEVLEKADVPENSFVLLYTSWSKFFRSEDYYENFPQVTKEFAEKLVELKVSALGLDTPSPDKPPYLVHKILLANDILIVENLTNIKLLLGKKFDICFLPMKLKADAAPVRVVAKIAS